MDQSARNIETINFVPVKKEEVKILKNEKFNTLEILVVLSAFVVIGLLVLLVINPGKEAAELRNIRRVADVSSILSNVRAYNNQYKEIPSEIPRASACVDYGNEICKSGPYDCSELVNMSFLTREYEELVVIPQDPLYISINGTGYYIAQDGEGLVTVCAPYAERNEKISFSKLMY